MVQVDVGGEMIAAPSARIEAVGEAATGEKLRLHSSFVTKVLQLLGDFQERSFCLS
jgi:hypothetical protein